MSADAAGPEPESAELARLSYAYRAIPYGIGAVDASGSCTEDMYIPYDAANPFGLADIKAAANDIAARGAASEYWWLYKHLMYRDERDKTNAKLKVGGAYHDVQILGLRQDRLTTPTEGREFAGLSFGFRDIYEGRSVNASDTNVGGWEATSLREYLRTTFYASLPDGVATVIEPVVKQQQLAGGGIQRTDGETVFIPSTFEVCGDTGNSGYLDETLENSFRYQLFDQFESEQPVANAIKAKDGTVMRWWLRSAHRNVANRFLCMEETGMRGYNLPHYGRGVVPCFCL